MLPSANDLKACHSLSILKWCDFILVLRSCDIKCYNNHYLATNSNFSSEKARLKTVNSSLAVPPSSFFCWVSDHPASSPETFSWHGVPSTARTVVLQLSCDGIWLPRSMGQGPGIFAHLRVSPQHCTWPRRLQTWDTDRAGGVPFDLTRVFATKKNALIEAWYVVCMCLVGMPDLSACILHGSAAESSSSKWLSLLSASSFPVVSLHHQLSAPKTSCWCRTDSNPGVGAFRPI